MSEPGEARRQADWIAASTIGCAVGYWAGSDSVPRALLFAACVLAVTCAWEALKAGGRWLRRRIHGDVA